MPRIHSQQREGIIVFSEVQARATAPPLVQLPVVSSTTTRPVMAGVAQEAASRTIGHKLSLIGVPAPTTLDGYRPANPDEIKTFMISVGLSEAKATDVATALKDELNITSIVQYGWWFADENLKEWFKSHQAWRSDAPLYVALKWALTTCSAIDKAKANHQEQLKEDDKIPMDPIFNKSLNEACNKLYHIPLAPSQEFTSQILNRMFRELKNWNGEAKPVEGLYTRENVLSIGQEERERKKRRKFATDFDLIDKTTPDNDDDPNFLPNESPWLFLIALEAMLHTFAKAGTYMVKDHISGDTVPNVDRIPVEEHLVMARKFVLEWMNRKSPPKEYTVIRILARIDIHIRRRWWRNYTDNPTWSFSRAIMAAEALADNQWSFHYASVLYAGQSSGSAWEAPGPNSWTNPHAPLGGGGRKGKRRKHMENVKAKARARKEPEKAP